MSFDKLNLGNKKSRYRIVASYFVFSSSFVLLLKLIFFKFPEDNISESYIYNIIGISTMTGWLFSCLIVSRLDFSITPFLLKRWYHYSIEDESDLKILDKDINNKKVFDKKLSEVILSSYFESTFEEFTSLVLFALSFLLFIISSFHINENNRILFLYTQNSSNIAYLILFFLLFILILIRLWKIKFTLFTNLRIVYIYLSLRSKLLDQSISNQLFNFCDKNFINSNINFKAECEKFMSEYDKFKDNLKELEIYLIDYNWIEAKNIIKGFRQFIEFNLKFYFKTKEKLENSELNSFFTLSRNFSNLEDHLSNDTTNYCKKEEFFKFNTIGILELINYLKNVGLYFFYNIEADFKLNELLEAINQFNQDIKENFIECNFCTGSEIYYYIINDKKDDINTINKLFNKIKESKFDINKLEKTNSLVI